MFMKMEMRQVCKAPDTAPGPWKALGAWSSNWAASHETYPSASSVIHMPPSSCLLDSESESQTFCKAKPELSLLLNSHTHLI